MTYKEFENTITYWKLMIAHRENAPKKSWFTVHGFGFNPKKKALNSVDVLEFVARCKKESKAKIKAEYDIVYGKATKHRRKDGTYLTFVICPKPEADFVFAFPKKWRKYAKNMISTVSVNV